MNVKIYNESLMPIGIVDIENLPQDTYGKFVKVFDDKFLPAGVIALGDLPHDTSGKYVKTIGNDFLPTGIVETGGGTPSPTPTQTNRKAYWREYSYESSGQQRSETFAVNENGQLIRKIDPNDDSNFYFVIESSGQVSLMDDTSQSGLYGQGWQTLLAAWGSEDITDFNIDNSSTGSFTLPAKNNVPAQQYVVDAAEVSPRIENYSE